MLDFRSKGPRFDPRPEHGDFLRVGDKAREEIIVYAAYDLFCVWQYLSICSPRGTLRRDYNRLTSTRCDDIDSTSLFRHFDIMCPLVYIILLWEINANDSLAFRNAKCAVYINGESRISDKVNPFGYFCCCPFNRFLIRIGKP